MAATGYDEDAFNDGFNGGLDNSPHGAVHVRVGGDMHDVPTAARDPIFWLHHANVDRLWNRWLAQGGSRQNPTDGVWVGFPKRNGADKPMKFPDENGNFVDITTQQVLDMAKNSYRYDDDTPPPVLAAASTPTDRAPPQRATVGSASQGSFRLSAEISVVPVSLGASGASDVKRTVQTMMASAPNLQRQNRVYVQVQGIQVTGGNPRIDYSVMVRPKGAATTQPAEYIGSLNFFGMHDRAGPAGVHGHSGGEPVKFDRRYDATDALKKLTESGRKSVDSIEVVFQPSQREEGAPPVNGVTFERIAVETVTRVQNSK
jgi:tyrosinase